MNTKLYLCNVHVTWEAQRRRGRETVVISLASKAIPLPCLSPSGLRSEQDEEDKMDQENNGWAAEKK